MLGKLVLNPNNYFKIMFTDRGSCGFIDQMVAKYLKMGVHRFIGKIIIALFVVWLTLLVIKKLSNIDSWSKTEIKI